MPGGSEEAEVAEPEPPAQSDPTGRWTRTNQVLGKGAFKIVYKGFDQQEGIEVAWNQIRMNELVSTKDDRERLYAEIRVLKQLKHKNIMSFHDSWLEQKGYTLNFITELFTSGTLRQYRKRHRSTDPEVMKRWAWQILCGLVYLHGHAPPIIHRDLKCDNIFINGSEGVVKIGDLGLATMLRARTAPQSVLGTPEFMAPELYDEDYDDRVDVYSFGMCMLELATLEYPYVECRNAAQIYRKVTLGVRPKALTKVANRELAEIISLCLARREERPRSRQLLKHPYFDSIRNEKLSLKLGQEALGVQDPSQPVPELAANANRSHSAYNGLPNGTSHILEPLREESDEDGTDAKSDHRTEPDLEHTGGGSMANEGYASTTTSPHHQPPQEDEDMREFRVRGKLQEHNDKLNLRLRIHQPDGTAKTVEFDFDLASDTAISVASEMVEEMSLSHGDASKIAHAIKEEIRSLTVKSAPQDAPTEFSGQTSATQSLDTASDDGGSSRHSEEFHPLSSMDRQESSGTKYEGAHCSKQSSRALSQEAPPAALKVVTEAQPTPPRQGLQSSDPPHTPCSDSVTSVHEHFSEASPPDNLFNARPIATIARPHSTLGFQQGPGGSGAHYAASAPGSTTSLGSPPARELTGSEPLQGAFSPMTASAREQLASALPPRGTQLRPSESLLRHLGRTDSANHAQEMEALQQAIAEKGAGKLFNLPNEEDRRLPLMKLLENLEGKPESAALASATTLPRAAPVPSAGNEAKEVPRPPVVPLNGTYPPLVIPEYKRSAEAISRGTSPASSTGRPMHEGSREFDLQNSLSGLGSCTTLPAGGLGEPLGVSRAKSKADLLEARRQAAKTSLKNMESNCLEGLDAFGVGPAKGKGQVPIRKMMGGPSSRSQ